MKEEYLGDGLYASYDGWQIRLRAPRENGDHEVYLDAVVFNRLIEWEKGLRAALSSTDGKVVMATAAPTPWDWIWVGANASGGGHIYLVDSTGRKIAAIWGKAEEKEHTADLIIRSVNGALSTTDRNPKC